MNSRDRLADMELAHQILDQLAVDIRNHQGLRLLRERRRQEDIAGKIAEEKPLQDVLEQILRRSPALANIFLSGTRLSNPFGSIDVQVAEKFHGRDHPTYFHFKGHKAGDPLARPANIGQRLHLAFETDVENEYFRRSREPGEIVVTGELNEECVEVTYGINLFNGLAHLNLMLPESAHPGDRLDLKVTVTDWTLVEEFINCASIDICAAVPPHPGPGGKRQDHNPKGQGDKTEPRPGGIKLPRVDWVYEAGWQREDFVRPMNQFSGMRATLAEAVSDKTGAAQYDFYVNADNIFLKTELKVSRQDPELVRAKFKYGMTLVGLGALRHGGESHPNNAGQDDQSDGDSKTADQSEEDLIAVASDVVAPMLLPMIDGLGGLELEEDAVDSSPDAQDLADLFSDEDDAS